ncbi:bis(5'-nucleosyl)-tetraphosphatase PrpE [Bacillus sp. SM2101]|uniref:bis(5'-nucleosyl)-tetraphosphatase PrpE n=1 Tax=Bacillus sp. SM2101 TaxID=2805366 RepID=UPI001BDE03EE|nr:bis(5'-nucleosyl)-tetraphosphatase PrpE [Bacillus sp. SM2101]
MDIDVIGDIHGCYNEFKLLTEKLGYIWSSGVPLHPNNRCIAFVGDITDRGPHSIRMINIVYSLVKNQHSFYVPGNHCNKLYRFFLGNKVQVTHGLETTVAEYNQLNVYEQQDVKSNFIELYENAPLYYQINNSKLIVAHAGIRADYIGRNDKQVKTFVLYGDITGKLNDDGTPIRRDWAQNYNGDSWIVYGHTPVKQPRIINKTINIDTGAVFGGSLTAFRYPEIETVAVQSTMPYIAEKFRTFEEDEQQNNTQS